MSGGGGGGGDKRDESIKSEREHLEEIERRMNIYDNLFGDMEQEMVAEAYGILNPDLITPYNRQIAALGDIAINADEKLAYLRERRDKFVANSTSGFGGAWGKMIRVTAAPMMKVTPGVIDFGHTAVNKFFPEYKTAGEDNGLYTTEDLGDGFFKETQVEKPPKRTHWKLSAKKRKALNDEINEILNAKRPQKDILEARTEAINTQQSNSRQEQTEQGRVRASGVADASFNILRRTNDLRDERFGVDPGLNLRAEQESDREFELLYAAAEAGARNKVKGDIDELAEAKRGALLGADFTDRQGAEQLRLAKDTYYNAATNAMNRADQYGAASDQAMAGAVGSLSDAGGSLLGSFASRSPTPTYGTSAQVFDSAWNPPPAVVSYGGPVG